MTRQLKPCGTVAAYRRHKRHKDDLDCERCEKAWKAYYNAWSRANYQLRKRAAVTQLRAHGGNQ